MNARTRQEFEHRQTLRDSGWDVPKADGVRFNSGSETLEHYLAKATIAWVAKQDDFRVASEVEGPGGEIDLILYGTEDPPVAVECERSMTDEVMQDKLERYVYGEPLRDMIPVDVDTISDVTGLREWAKEESGI